MARRVLLVKLDKVRPAVELTRSQAAHLTRVTVAPITSTVRGIGTEVAVSTHNGLEHASVVSCDNVITIRRDQVVRVLGVLMPEQEEQLRAALLYAFDFDVEP